MRTFLAFLADSYREAVSGWILQVMLGVSTLLLVGIASLSFDPAPADQVLPDLVKRFAVFIPDKGGSKAIAATNPKALDFSVTNVTQFGRDVSFRLEVKPAAEKAEAAKDAKAPPAGPDQFRRMVAGWAKPAVMTQKLKPPADGKRRSRDDPDSGVELALQLDVSPTEAATVTDDQMTAFIANQFAAHVGVGGASVKRVAGPAEPAYQFDVELKGATSALGWTQQLGLFFGAVTLGNMELGLTLFIIQDQVINGIGATVVLALSVVITAFFIPNLLRKGALDLVIAKPVGRVQVLLYKYFGGLIFITVLSAYTIGGTWAILGLRTGHWDPRFLLVLPAITFTFALVYAVSTLVAVLTRSAIAAILISLGFMFFLWVVGLVKVQVDRTRTDGPEGKGSMPEWVYATTDALNSGLPRYKDLDKVMQKITAESTLPPVEMRVIEALIEYPSLSGPIAISVGYIVLFLGLASWRLVTRDG